MINRFARRKLHPNPDLEKVRVADRPDLEKFF